MYSYDAMLLRVAIHGNYHTMVTITELMEIIILIFILFL